VLGFGWDTAGGEPPTFNAFPLSGAPECSKATCLAGFATLEPNTNPDQIGNTFGQFAAEAGANPGVLGIFDTGFTNGPLGCPVQFSSGTAYAYGSGNQGAGNSYNISPGSPGSAWKVPVSQADCNVEHPGVGGGPSGFGVLESDEGHGTTVYHRFDAGTMKFDTPMVTVANQSELYAAVSQDGAGGIYGTYLLDGPGGPINLSYSGDGGKSFTSAVLNPNKDALDDHVTSAVNGAGQGWAAWINNGSVFAQPFQAADAIAPVSEGGSATDNGTTITVTVTCSSLPCTITITITSNSVSVKTASVTHRKRKNVVLAKGRFRITKAGARKLAVKLTPAGKRFLASKKGHVKVGSIVAQTAGKHTKLTQRNLRLTIKPKKGK
jgi:carbon monoxide dehydrogenase subunit G